MCDVTSSKSERLFDRNARWKWVLCVVPMRCAGDRVVVAAKREAVSRRLQRIWCTGFAQPRGPTSCLGHIHLLSRYLRFTGQQDCILHKSKDDANNVRVNSATIRW